MYVTGEINALTSNQEVIKKCSFARLYTLISKGTCKKIQKYHQSSLSCENKLNNNIYSNTNGNLLFVLEINKQKKTFLKKRIAICSC